MVFDLKKVNRINSRGLNALISALKTIRKEGGDIKLAQIDDHLKDVFIQTRLVQVFNTYETVGRAMASFTG
jgi:anti-sigma B factor antagonist